MAFESSTICVVLSEASIEGCAGRGACGIARLKLDLVAISVAMIWPVSLHLLYLGVWSCSQPLRGARGCCGERQSAGGLEHGWVENMQVTLELRVVSTRTPSCYTHRCTTLLRKTTRLYIESQTRAEVTVYRHILTFSTPGTTIADRTVGQQYTKASSDFTFNLKLVNPTVTFVTFKNCEIKSNLLFQA